jgi:hypothetical protein
MRDIGYESFNILMNLGTLAFLLVLYIIKLLSLLTLWPIAHLTKAKFFKDLYKQTYNQVFWSDLILLLVQGYLEFIISSILTLLTPLESVDYTPTFFYIAYVFLFISLVALPALYIWIIAKDFKELTSKKFQRRFGALVEGHKFE